MSEYYDAIKGFNNVSLDDILKDIFETDFSELMERYKLNLLPFILNQIGEAAIMKWQTLKTEDSQLLQKEYSNLKELFKNFENDTALMNIMKEEIKPSSTDDENSKVNNSSDKRKKLVEDINSSLKKFSGIFLETKIDSPPKKLRRIDEQTTDQ